MRQTRPGAKKATRLSLDDEIAHLRGLDLHGLRARYLRLLAEFHCETSVEEWSLKLA
jgi:hypothetical protein